MFFSPMCYYFFIFFEPVSGGSTVCGSYCLLSFFIFYYIYYISFLLFLQTLTTYFLLTNFVSFGHIVGIRTRMCCRERAVCSTVSPRCDKCCNGQRMHVIPAPRRLLRAHSRQFRVSVSYTRQYIYLSATPFVRCHYGGYV